MSTDFDAENQQQWQEAIRKVFPIVIPESAEWTSLDAMIQVLTPFCPLNCNHTLLPSGGGMDIIKVAKSWEHGAIELFDDPRGLFVSVPARLCFEYFPESPWNSFFLIENAPLAPTGVYPEKTGLHEELLEIKPGNYVERSYADRGYLGHDESGDEIPLPADYKYVTRFFSGKFLMVAKASLWNWSSGSYDGFHNKFSAKEIRSQISEAIRMCKTAV